MLDIQFLFFETNRNTEIKSISFNFLELIKY